MNEWDMPYNTRSFDIAKLAIFFFTTPQNFEHQT